MTCQRCESPCQGGLCKQCELELAHGTPTMPDSGEWSVDQQGLGDRDAAGQATLDGGIVRGDGDD
jgi:hypothetical protein